MLNELNASLSLIASATENNYAILATILGLLFFVFLLNKVLNNRLLYLGIIPRHFYGLAGILCAPLLHAHFNHLFFNAIPLVVLSNFILMNGLDYFYTVTLLITVLSGILIWCFAKPGIHIGASAVITGYWGLLVANIFQYGGITALILGIVCFYYFAGIFLGIFPSKKGVSWEGHLFGLISGIFVSYFMDYIPHLS